MLLFLEVAAGVAVLLWVLVVLGFSWQRMRLRLQAMRMQTDAQRRLNAEKGENHRNGDDRVA